MNLARRAAGEATGTALLLATIVGSGIMGERLAGGNVALALLANSLATGAVLVALILALAPISGAHLNPAISLGEAWQRVLAWRDVPVYLGAQVAGAVVGVVVANRMFELPAISFSQRMRAGPSQWLAEAVATFGLVFVVKRVAASHDGRAVAIAVGGYIAGAYWFTASTSFANPAVTLARALTDTFAGIRPSDVPGFVAAQLAGGGLAFGFARWLEARR